MKSKPDFSNTRPRGCITGLVVGFIYFSIALSMIISALITHNNLYFVVALGQTFMGLLSTQHFHNWFFGHAKPIMDKFEGKMNEGIKRGVVRAWERRATILVFIIFGLLIAASPVPNMIHNQIDDSLCNRNLTAPFFCGNGVGITSLPVDEGKNNMNIGILDNSNWEQAPFNQYDANNDGAERNLENRIFQQNLTCGNRPYVTLVVATSLSQTIADVGLSSNVGLDSLRGAYMAQYNFNHAPSQQFCLHLLIANFGTKEVVAETMPTVMQQIKLYADSDPQHFMGVVGFPFSSSVTEALYWRSANNREDIPIISSAAVAENFLRLKDSQPPSANFYTNFYRVVSPVSEEGKALKDFMANHSRNYLAPTLTKTVLFQDSTDVYSRSLAGAVFGKLGENATPIEYREGQPESFTEGIQYIINNQCRPGRSSQCKPIQIFFSGYGDDLSTLRNKLNAQREKGVLMQNSVRIIGGGGLYDLGSYDVGNYANLFFTIRASYTWIDPTFQSDVNGIAVPSEFQRSARKAPYDIPFNYEFLQFFGQQIYPTSIYGHELAGTHVLLLYDAIQVIVDAWSHSDKGSDLKQAISQHWGDVKLQGVSGPILLSQSNSNPNMPNNPDGSKPIYVACTDNHGSIHTVAEYNADGLVGSVREDELSKCLKGT